MSIKVMQNTWEYSQHQGSRLNILLGLSDHANDRGISWPSLTRLSHLSRSSKRNVRRHLRALEDTGEIFTIPRQGTTSFYLVTIGFSENELIQTLEDVLHSPLVEIKKYAAAIVSKRGYAAQFPASHQPREKEEGENPEPGEEGTPMSRVGEDASVRGGGTPMSGGGGTPVSEVGGTPTSGGGGTPVSGGKDIRVRGGGTPTSPKPSSNHQLTPKNENSSSSSSSKKGDKSFARGNLPNADDDEDDELLRLLRAAGISAQNQKNLLKGNFSLEDVLAEFARCHTQDSRVRKPHVIMPMNLLKGDFPDATCYKASFWERHIPEVILKQSGLTEHIREQAQEERGVSDGNYDDTCETPLLGGNGKTPRVASHIPEEHQKWWDMALGQLQLQMPKVAFDTWVRDIVLLSTEESVFTVGAKNEYARDWLEGRLKSTLIRLLSGAMGQTIQVKFVVKETMDT